MTDAALARAEHQSPTVQDININKGAVLKYLGLRDDDPAAQAAVLICQRYGLDPVLKHVVLIEERAKNDNGQWEKVGKPFITRDGMLHIAHASGQLDGIEMAVDPHLNDDGTHWEARVAVYRQGMSRPFSFPGRFPRKRTRWTGSGDNRRQVKEDHPYGPEMAVKNTVSISLRHAFDVSAPVLEERFDRPDIVEASVQAHVEQTGGLSDIVRELATGYGSTRVLAVANERRDRADVDEGPGLRDEFRFLEQLHKCSADFLEGLARELMDGDWGDGADQAAAETVPSEAAAAPTVGPVPDSESTDALVGLVTQAVADHVALPGGGNASRGSVMARAGRIAIGLGVAPPPSFDQLSECSPELLAELVNALGLQAPSATESN